MLNNQKASALHALTIVTAAFLNPMEAFGIANITIERVETPFLIVNNRAKSSL